MKHSDYHTLCDALSKAGEICERANSCLYSADIISGMTEERKERYESYLEEVVVNLLKMQSILIKSKYEANNHD